MPAGEKSRELADAAQAYRVSHIPTTNALFAQDREVAKLREWRSMAYRTAPCETHIRTLRILEEPTRKSYISVLEITWD